MKKLLTITIAVLIVAGAGHTPAFTSTTPRITSKMLQPEHAEKHVDVKRRSQPRDCQSAGCPPNNRSDLPANFPGAPEGIALYRIIVTSASELAPQEKQVTCKSLIGDAKQDARLRLPVDFPEPPGGVTYCGQYGTRHRFLNGKALSLDTILRHYQAKLRSQGYRIEPVRTNARGLSSFSFNRGDTQVSDGSRDIGRLDTGSIYNLAGSSADPPKGYEIGYTYGSRSPRRPH